MGRIQIVSFLHIGYSRDFVYVSFVEISYIMNTHGELDEMSQVSSAVYVNIYLAKIYYLMDILEIDFLL